MSERIFLSILICCGAVFLYFGIKIDAPFAYGPVGPKAFPLLLGTAFIVLCALCLWRGGASDLMLKGRVATIASVLLFYLLTFRFLGFMLATTISVYAAARAVGSTWMQGLLTGLIISIFFYGIFHFFLQVPLPRQSSPSICSCWSAASRWAWLSARFPESAPQTGLHCCCL